jgi:hypothetical protein
MDNRERILKAVREKIQRTYKSKPNKSQQITQQNLKSKKSMQQGLAGNE